MDKYINITKAENDPCASRDNDDAELQLSEEEKPSLSVTVSMPVGSPTKASTSTCTLRSPLPSTSSVQESDTSNPWPFLEKYYKFTGVKGNNVEYKCLICAPKIKVISANRRSMHNLKLHMTRVHPNLAKNLNNLIETATKERKRSRSGTDKENDTQPCTKQQKIEHSMAFASRAVCQSNVDQKIITFFVDNMLPLEVVDSATFGSLIKTLQPAINVMSRRSLTRKIEERFRQATEDLKALLANVQSVATTADVWSCRNRSYLGMTVHWIDPTTMKRKRSVLACRRLLGRHTYNILAKMMETVHMEFRIENKVKRTTTDNGSNFVKAFRLFGDEVIDNSHNEANEGDENEDITEIVDIADILEAESGEQSGNEMYVLPQHQRCAAHNLNLVATSDAEKAMTSSSSYKKIYRSAFAKARELWNKQCRSTQAADVIKMELGKMLVVPTATRWNSVYDSVTCLVTVYDKKTTELNRVCNILKIPLFTLCDMSLLKEYILVLKPVAVSLDILQGEEKAFMGLLVPVINVCVQKLKATKDKTLRHCAPLVDALLMGIQTRFSNQLEDLDCIIASAFHPQFKLTWCKDESKLKEVRQKMISLVDGKLSNTNTQATSSSRDDEENADSFFNELQKPRGHTHVNEGDRLVKNYLESPLSTALPAPESFPCNPFLEIFVEYNTPIPSSAAVERMFSLGKDILKPKRSSLSDIHFEMLVFLKDKISV